MQVVGRLDPDVGFLSVLRTGLLASRGFFFSGGGLRIPSEIEGI